MKTTGTEKGRVGTWGLRGQPGSRYTPLAHTVTKHKAQCRACCRAKRPTRSTRERVVAAKYAQQYRRDHPEYTRNYMYLWRYGISRADAITLLREQGYKCAICRAPLRVNNERQWHVDHDHKSKRVRGVLCNCCNTGLGKLGDTVKTLTAALRYLKGH